MRISARAQMTVAGAVFALLLGWAAFTMAMAWNQWRLSARQAEMATQARAIAEQQRKVDRYKRSVGDIAADLDRRQDALDEMVRGQFGGAALEGAVVGEQPAAAAKEAAAPARKISALAPSATSPSPVEALRNAEQRQIAFARRLAALADARAAKAEAAIRSFGLNPAQLARPAQGGPFIPWIGKERHEDAGAEALAALAASLARLDALERGLLAIPSGAPTQTPMLTSSFGYRRDPFNGRAAFHAGLDFPGSYGQPILAAAAGRVSFVGGQQGYGQVVEIDHGNGMMTRYAHLSGFAARPGQSVAKGQPIGRMGSTGRSTGTHLHFEVRVNGTAINPRRFLEVHSDVLQIQQTAARRRGAAAGV